MGLLLLEGLLNLLFPPKCPFCGKVLDSPGICSRCRETMPETGEEASQPLMASIPCVSPLYYRDEVRDALLRLKFHHDPSVAEPLGNLMADCVSDCYDGRFDVITWAPVSRERLRERGYDQAKLLAQAMGRRWKMKPRRLLKKRFNNAAQSRQRSSSARFDNVRNVYVPAGTADGLRVLLVDDIRTTGATLLECARVLQEEAGAEEVLCVTAAAGMTLEDTAKVEDAQPDLNAMYS